MRIRSARASSAACDSSPERMSGRDRPVGIGFEHDEEAGGAPVFGDEDARRQLREPPCRAEHRGDPRLGFDPFLQRGQARPRSVPTPSPSITSIDGPTTPGPRAWVASSYPCLDWVVVGSPRMIGLPSSRWRRPLAPASRRTRQKTMTRIGWSGGEPDDPAAGAWALGLGRLLGRRDLEAVRPEDEAAEDRQAGGEEGERDERRHQDRDRHRRAEGREEVDARERQRHRRPGDHQRRGRDHRQELGGHRARRLDRRGAPPQARRGSRRRRRRGSR